MTDASGSVGTMKFVDLSLRELLRYGYGGALAIGLSAVIDPTTTKDVIATLGSGLLPIVAILIGACCYVTYRQSLGVTVVLWIVWLLHWLLDVVCDFLRCIFCSWKGDNSCNCYWLQQICRISHCKHKYGQRARRTVTCRYRYLQSLGVGCCECLDAYRHIQQCVPDKRWASFHDEHTELHVAFLTFFELLVAGVVASWFYPSKELAGPFLLLSVAFLVVGVFGDIRLSRRETAFLRSLGKTRLLRALRTGGYVRRV